MNKTYKVLKTHVNAFGTEVDAAPAGLAEGTFVTVSYDPESEYTQGLVVEGAIEQLPDEVSVEPKLEAYRAILDAVFVSDKTLLKGETVMADSNDPVVQGLVAAGALELAGSVAEADTTVNQIDTSEAASTALVNEPRKRYRGHVVVEEGLRTVEGHTYHHVKLDDGSEMDLSDGEYDTEVKMSYPPVK